jgi:hypothetical protein
MRAVLLFTVFAAAGCNSSSPAEPAPRDAGSALVDAQGTTPGLEGGGFPDAQPASGCFTNPTTYLEIINACTDAEAVDKVVDLSPMNLADGGLQPLP